MSTAMGINARVDRSPDQPGHGLEEREQDHENACLHTEYGQQCQRATGQGRLAEQPHAQQRGSTATQFPCHETGGGEDADARADQCRGIGPAALGTFLQHEDEPDHRDELFAVFELAGYPRFLPENAPEDRPGLEERCHAISDQHHAEHVPHRGADWGRN
ncbi:hypothetical protein ACQP0C_02550 [Nocardia sp. CA-129566]|uniref:hypothetical protein n=1 Tax=Nocardia sp. CA-129566 TaxID=3239976 RepID=UPI003D97075E